MSSINEYLAWAKRFDPHSEEGVEAFKAIGIVERVREIMFDKEASMENIRWAVSDWDEK